MVRYVLIFGLGLVLAVGFSMHEPRPTESDAASSCSPHWQEYTVRGDSMSPLLFAGDVLEVDMNYYDCYRPHVGDIVVLAHPHRDVPLIKMVYAVAGDAIEFIANTETSVYHLMVNKQMARVGDRPFVFTRADTLKIQAYIDAYAGVVPADYALILGLNPAGSLDSTEYGLYHYESFLGRVDITH